MMSALSKLFIRAAWAPLAVLVFHAIIARTSLRTPLDFPIHFLGGVAIAYFWFHALDCFSQSLGQTTTLGRHLFSFGLSCTVGLFWEFAELCSDVFLHTHIQGSIRETMSDLIADATGAALSLFLLFLVRWLRR